MSTDPIDVEAVRALASDELAALIHATERDQMAHGPDPYTGTCRTCRTQGCEQFSVLSAQLGVLRDIRDGTSANTDGAS